MLESFTLTAYDPDIGTTSEQVVEASMISVDFTDRSVTLFDADGEPGTPITFGPNARIGVGPVF